MWFDPFEVDGREEDEKIRRCSPSGSHPRLPIVQPL